MKIKAREGWEFPKSDTDRNVLRTIQGQKRYVEEHASAGGSVELSNATAHWWILRDEAALTQNSGRIASSGHTAALYKNELYEMATGRAGVARLQLFGVIFGYQRVVIYLEPQQGADLTTNTARTNLILEGDALPWAEWAAEFRERMPDEINALMEEVAGVGPASDHREAIKERLRQIRELFRLSRYRPTPRGTVAVDDSEKSGGASRAETTSTKSDGAGGGGRGGRAGNVYALFLADDGAPAEETSSFPDPDVDWISAEDSRLRPREAGFLEDRAAKYLPEQNLLQINADFRAFTDMVDRWCEKYSHVPGARDTIQDVVREWCERSPDVAIGDQRKSRSGGWPGGGGVRLAGAPFGGVGGGDLEAVVVA